MITLLAFVVVIGVLIFVHELGHFVTAKLVGIEVPRFSIGLGPKAWGFKRGETEYVISWLPLGGYVKMAGMEELEAIEGGPADGRKERGAHAAPRKPGPRDFESKSLPARMLVISAGVIMNIAFAVVVFAAIAMIWGLPLPLKPILGGVAEESLPAQGRPFLDVPAGSHVVAVGDHSVESWQQFQQDIVTAPGGSELTVRFQRVKPVTFEVPKLDSLKLALVTSLLVEQHTVPLIGQVIAGSPAERAGMKAGDRVLYAGWGPGELLARLRERGGAPAGPAGTAGGAAGRQAGGTDRRARLRGGARGAWPLRRTDRCGGVRRRRRQCTQRPQRSN